MSNTTTAEVRRGNTPPTITPERPRVTTLRSEKIADEHLQRLAIVYVRQSTPQQVLEHRESTARQYALVDRATALGCRKPAPQAVSATMSNTTSKHESVTEQVLQLFRLRGDSEYGGEAVTQLEHALQAATFAEREGANPALIAAALIHDIGHFQCSRCRSCSIQV